MPGRGGELVSEIGTQSVGPFSAFLREGHGQKRGWATLSMIPSTQPEGLGL